ncbi:MAG: type IV pilus assembly protein PilM [Candidatus Pacebacteria bacterium]|nr:type IV pilus assembly protein PilM [Candidatus Paceibacterota bacterium]MBP9842651.1 type IV pilus assembly protein PilM [Candidatus Paceibacterota bacterium]
MKSLKDIFSSMGGGDSAASVVGIDIGSSSIKVVELQNRKGVITLATYGELQLGPYAEKQIGESVVLTAKQEQEAVVDVLRESGVSARKAVFAMPLSSSFVTNVSIEATPEDDISALVRVEARKVIPASLSEVTLDWAEVETGDEKTKKKDVVSTRSVLIAAIQNAALERFKVLMQFAGIEQPPTEIECFSTIRSLYNSKDKEVVVVDIGAISTKLYIARGGLLMRMHRIRAGGAVATNRIASVLNCSFEDAEIKKQNANRADADFSDAKRAHDSSYERAFREFGQVLREYEEKNGVTFATVYVSGGGAMFPGTDTLLQEVLGRQVVRANPFSKVAYPAFMQDTIKEIGPSFTVALGAALRSFDE